jgi:hypothetical protein
MIAGPEDGSVKLERVETGLKKPHDLAPSANKPSKGYQHRGNTENEKTD